MKNSWKLYNLIHVFHSGFIFTSSLNNSQSEYIMDRSYPLVFRSSFSADSDAFISVTKYDTRQKFVHHKKTSGTAHQMKPTEKVL